MDGVFFCRCSDFEKGVPILFFCATKIGNPRSYRPYIVVCTSKLILVVKGLTEAILSPGNVWPKHKGLQVFLGVPRRAYDTGSSFLAETFSERRGDLSKNRRNFNLALKHFSLFT